MNILDLRIGRCPVMPFDVAIDRDGCISCCSCHTNCPDVFELSPEDGLSQIKTEYRKGGSLGEGVVPDGLEGCARLAEDLCPVSVIHVAKQ